MTNEMTLALAAALNSKTSTGKFNEPHQLRTLVNQQIKEDIHWAARVLRRTLINAKHATPDSVKHWVTFGQDRYKGRVVELLSKYNRGMMSEQDDEYMTKLALRFSKQAVAYMLLNA